MNEIMRRVSQVERRVVEQDDDLADSRIMSTRAEGMISALQGRQVQLEAKVSATDLCLYILHHDASCGVTSTNI